MEGMCRASGGSASAKRESFLLSSGSHGTGKPPSSKPLCPFPFWIQKEEKKKEEKNLLFRVAYFPKKNPISSLGS